MLQTKEITNKITWENFLSKYTGFFPLFQTWQWGDVQKSLGFEIKRIGLFDDKKLVGIALIVEIHAKRGKYFHVRQGPVVASLDKSYWEFFIKEIISLARSLDMDFVRVSPLQSKEEALTFPSPTIAAPIHNMDAEVCWVLDITPSPEDILKAMRKSHRYLVKKAQTMPITIRRSTNAKDIERFLPLYKELAKKKHFVAHKGLVEELSVFGQENMSELFLAEYEGKIICGALIDYVGNMAIYRHSASDEAYRNVPAMYLLQWEVILEAKKRGKKLYNFWGIASNEHKNHPWYGLTLFKTGFGGEKKEFMHARDIILSPRYLKTFAIDYITKIRKGY